MQADGDQALIEYKIAGERAIKVVILNLLHDTILR